MSYPSTTGPAGTPTGGKMNSNRMPSLLDDIRAEWAAQGWPEGDLSTFRMDGDDPPPPDPPEPPEPPDDKKTFTQDDVQRIAAREKAEGKKSAERELREKFGVSSLEDLQEIVDRQRAADDANKTEAEKAAERARQDAAEAEKNKQEAATERLVARVERALAKAGLDDEKQIERAVRLVDVDDEATVEDVAAAVDELKEDMPQLFTEPPEEEDPNNKTKRPRHSDPGKPPKPTPPQDARGRAKSRLEKRHPHVKKD